MSRQSRNLSTTRRQVFGDVEPGTTCRVCGRNVDDGRAKHCSEYCRNIVESVMQLLNWSSVRRRVLNRDDRTCQECGFKQEWLDRGYDHLRSICEEQLPERPENPALKNLVEVSDERLEELEQARQEWRDRKNQLIEEYFGISVDYFGSQWPSPENRLEVDHITPVSEGGHPFDPANLQTLCSDCHEDKTARENSTGSEDPRMERPETSLVEFIVPGGEQE